MNETDARNAAEGQRALDEQRRHPRCYPPTKNEKILDEYGEERTEMPLPNTNALYWVTRRVRSKDSSTTSDGDN